MKTGWKVVYIFTASVAAIIPWDTTAWWHKPVDFVSFFMCLCVLFLGDKRETL